MSTTVTYDTFSFHKEGFSTPYVSRSDQILSYGNRWGQGTSYNLNGQITGYSFSDIIEKQGMLITGFQRDFKSLDITEDGQSVAGFPISNCKINNISFNTSKYIPVIDYDISIDAYDEGLFSGSFGVTEPSDQVNISEGEDGAITLTHDISARGFTTDGKTAIENAKDFVHSNTGWNEQVFPKFITYQQFDKTVYDSDFSSSVDSWAPTNGSTSFSTISSKRSLKFIATEEIGSHNVYQTFSEIEVGKEYKIEAEIFIGNTVPLEYQNVTIVELSNNSSDGSDVIVEGGTQGQWVKVEKVFIATTQNIYIKAKESSGDYTFQGDSTYDWFAVSNIRLRRHYGFKPLLTSQNENIDRLNGVYSVNETYVMSNTGEQKLFSGYNIDISSGIGEDFLNVDFSASYRGAFGEDISETRNKIPELNCQYYYNLVKNISNISDLNSGASNFSVSENSGSRMIDLSVSFNNNNLYTGSNAYFDYEISAKTNELTSNTTLSINGTIKAIGHKKDRFQIAQNFLQNTIYAESVDCKNENKFACYLYNLANSEYVSMSKGYTLNKYPLSTNISENESQGTITLSAQFNDNYNYSNDIKISNWSISVKPPLRKYFSTMDVLTYPKHIFWNSQVLDRSSIKVNASAISYSSIHKSYGLTSVDNFIENVYNVYVSPNSSIAEESNELSFSETSLSYNRNKSWSFHNDTEWVILPAPPKP
tara:strand:- start:47997 stop:50114 length:2118 start_codon:yes stop_codon:yes gene_type:complete